MTTAKPANQKSRTFSKWLMLIMTTMSSGLTAYAMWLMPEQASLLLSANISGNFAYAGLYMGVGVSDRNHLLSTLKLGADDAK